MANPKLTSLFKVAPVLLGASFVATQTEAAFGQTTGSSEQEVLEQINEYNNQGNGELDQVTSVFELEDVSPDDWAFEALQGLVERYGCIAGYPDGTFRGNQAMTRYEFAAGLNACLQQMERLIAEGGNVSEEDFRRMQRLQQEFDAELTALGTRVDDLEGRVNTLEDQQFSTTTKLSGYFAAAAVQPFGGERADGFGDVDENTGLIYQGQLNFDASFTGRDRLRVQFRTAEVGNPGGAPFQRQATGEPLTELFDIFDETNGDFKLNVLSYRFPVGDSAEVAIGASGGSDFIPAQVFESNFGSGANLSDLILQGDLDTAEGGGRLIDGFSPNQFGAGISTRIDITDRLSFGAGYTVREDAARDPNIGLFKDHSIAANLNYAGDNFDIGLNYGRTQAGTPGLDPNVDDFEHNAVGLSGAVRFSPSVELGGWVTYVNQQSNEADRDGWAFSGNLAINDLGKEGSKLALGVASPAFFGNFDGSQPTDLVNEDARAYVGELSYKYPLNDNLSITPGVIAVFNPGRDSDNDTVYTGVIQTTFSF